MNLFADLVPGQGGPNTHFPLNPGPVMTPGGGGTGAPLQGTAAPPTGPRVHPGTPATPATPAATPNPSLAALNGFANSAGMQFQQQQSANALNNLYAARGQIESGAAMKEIPGFLQQEALQNYFMPYMGLLQGQQSVGAGAASSIAGVGSSFGNTAAGINQNIANGTTGILNGMGGAIGNAADAASNAAIARGAAGAGLGSAIGSGLGTLGSSFFAPSSFGTVASPNFFAPMSMTLPQTQPLSSLPGFN